MSGNVMRKIYNIAKGWFIFLFYKRSEMSKSRLKICAKCELRQWYFCGECGCELHAKSEVEDEKCPHPKGNKWGKRMRYLDGGFVEPSDNTHSNLGNYPYPK